MNDEKEGSAGTPPPWYLPKDIHGWAWAIVGSVVLAVIVGVGARVITLLSDPEALVLGGLHARHKSSYGVATEVDYHSITFTDDGPRTYSFYCPENHIGTAARTGDQNSEPSEHDFAFDFDLTSTYRNQVRVIGINIEVIRSRPIPDVSMTLVPLMGLGETKDFFGFFCRPAAQYPTSFQKKGRFVTLAKNELEHFAVQTNTTDPGVYDLRLAIEYSVSGESHVLQSEVVRDLWFVPWSWVIGPEVDEILNYLSYSIVEWERCLDKSDNAAEQSYCSDLVWPALYRSIDQIIPTPPGRSATHPLCAQLWKFMRRVRETGKTHEFQNLEERIVAVCRQQKREAMSEN